MPLSPEDATPHPRASALRELIEIARAAGLPELADAIRQIEAALERGALTVAVLGQFKRGKSTLLNVIAGRELLPSGPLPVTSVPIAIRQGPGEARITFPGRSSMTIPLDEIGKYVTQRQNPGNRLGVGGVEVGVPLPEWAREVTFVDTPGIGSVIDENTAASRALLPEVDAAIFVFSSDPPLTDNERSFLADAAKYATKFFFVLNKTDLLTASELEEMRSYTETLLRDRCGFSSPRIFPVSAREALRRLAPGASTGPDLTGVPPFLQELRRYLVTDRFRAVDEVRRHRVVQYVRRLKEVIELSLHASRLSEEEFSQKSWAMEQGLAEFELQRRAADALLDDAVRAAFEDRDRRLKEFYEAETPRLTRTMQGFVREMDGHSGAQVARGFDERFRAVLSPLVATLRAERAREMSTALRASFRQYEGRLRRSLEAFDGTASDLFDVRLTPIVADVAFSDALRYSSAVEPLFEGTVLGQTFLILPGAILRRSLRSRLARIVDEELDAQCGRIRNDMTERTARSVEEFRHHTRSQFEADVGALRGALEAGRSRHSMNRESAQQWEGTREQWLVLLDKLEAEARGELGDPENGPRKRSMGDKSPMPQETSGHLARLVEE